MKVVTKITHITQLYNYQKILTWK